MGRFRPNHGCCADDGGKSPQLVKGILLWKFSVGRRSSRSLIAHPSAEGTGGSTRKWASRLRFGRCSFRAGAHSAGCGRPTCSWPDGPANTGIDSGAEAWARTTHGRPNPNPEGRQSAEFPHAPHNALTNGLQRHARASHPDTHNQSRTFFRRLAEKKERTPEGGGGEGGGGAKCGAKFAQYSGG